MSDGKKFGMTRRQALGASGVALAGALAGCVAGEEGEGTTTGETTPALTPPATPPVPDDRYWAFVVESLEYQNQVLSELRQDG